MTRTIQEIKKNLDELYPKKELALFNYKNNANSFLENKLWTIYDNLARRWNELIEEHQEALEKNNE